jgi:thiosulfate/3-mercaptopyruvate sulfurtransferase
MLALMPPLVNSTEAQQLLAAGAIVLDARSTLHFYADGHLPTAVRVGWRIGTSGSPSDGSLGAVDAAAAAFAALGVRKHLPVLIVGDWDAGWGEEGRIFWDLEYLGHKDVHVLRGGMRAWTGPRSTLSTWTASAGDFVADPDSAKRVSTAQLAASLASPSPPRVWDVREASEFDGATPYGETRGGHIPGAVNIPWRQLLTDVPASGVGPIVVTCTGGVRSGMAYLLLRNANIDTVANYDGGMWEWARTPHNVTTRNDATRR